MRWTRPRLKELMLRLEAAYPDARCALDHSDPFQLVVATILSAQCTDARVNLTTPALFRRFPDAAALAEAPLAELEGLIHPTGFFRNKARNLVGLGQALVAQHGGRVPDTLAALSALPGVGQKTANVVLSNAFGVPALPVDTHIFRVARRLGLSEANTPEKVEADLCGHFPREAWIALHHQLIWHGREVCHARGPRCTECPLHAFCPTGLGKQADPHTGEALAPGARPLAPSRRESHPQPQAGSPQRIVSLVPSLTEQLVRWGLARRLVGRTRYCIEPRWIRSSVPALGGTKDPDLERIRELQPDLVILERSENTREAAESLQQAGIPLLVLDIGTPRSVQAALRELGTRVGLSASGEQAAQALQPFLDCAPKARIPALILVWREPWTGAGPGSYPGELARAAGFEPLGAIPYPRWSETEFEALCPRLILLPSEPYRWTARHAAELARRFPEARVERVEGRSLTWYLSRTVEGLSILKSMREYFE